MLIFVLRVQLVTPTEKFSDRKIAIEAEATTAVTQRNGENAGSSSMNRDLVVSLDPAPEAPYVTAAQMALVDRVMAGHFCVGMIQMRENTGRELVRLARFKFLGSEGAPMRSA